MTPDRFSPSSETKSALQRLVERSADLMCVVKADGFFEWVSPSWEEVLGWTEEELLGSPFAEFIHPADRDATGAAVARVFEGDRVTQDNRYRTKAGVYRHIQWVAAADQGDSPAIFAIGRDVTELHENQRELEGRAQMMEMAEGLAGVGRWRVDLRANSLFWTPTIFEIHGMDPSEPAPSVEEAINAYHPDDREMVAEHVARAIEEGESFSFHARIVRPDGTVRDVDSNGAAEVDEDGSVVGILGVFRDVTEEREMSRRLRLAERMASLGTISSGVAHEINNPLTWLIGNLELLETQLEETPGGISEETRAEWSRLLSASMDGGARIARIVDGLRSFSDEATLHEVVRLGEAVDTAVAVVQNEVHHRARFVLDVDRSCEVLGDETRLVQILANLLMNAAQSIEPGRAAEDLVRLTVRRAPDEGTIVVVEDTGCGIAEGDLSRIWDPFFTTQPVGTGTGLGLSVVHSLVEQHGGTIGVASTVGEGTVITIHFPSVSAVEAEAPDGGESVDAEAREDRASAPHTVLVVDDEPAILRLMQRALSGHVTALPAADGREAIGLLSQNAEIDAVVCDIMMPEVSGIEVWEWIAENRPGLLPQTLIMTGGVFTSEAKAFIRENDPALLEKPFTLASLRSRLFGLLDETGA